MNLFTFVSVGTVVVATFMLPAYLDRTRRFIGPEPSSTLLTYMAVLTPRWLATGVLLFQCMEHGEWGSPEHAFLRYAFALAGHVLLGLICLFAISLSSEDLRELPLWTSGSLVSVGFVVPLGQMLFATWYLSHGPDFELRWVGVGPVGALVALGFAVFGAGVLSWAVAIDLRARKPTTGNPQRGEPSPVRLASVSSPHTQSLPQRHEMEGTPSKKNAEV